MTLLIGALCAGIVLAGGAGMLVPPTARLAPRLRPHTVLARVRLGRSPDPFSHGADHGPLRALATPLFRSALALVSRVVERRTDEALVLVLAQAGFDDVTPDEYRTRVALSVLAFAGAGAVVGLGVVQSPTVTIALVACGAVFGATRARGRIDRAVTARRARIRLELYTVNQLLAMHVRTGAGPIQATQRIVDRGRGVLAEELGGVLRAVRSGLSEPAAFRRAAELTPEPAAARTYKLLAAGAERGVDLAAGLRALSEDLRDARREEIRKTATKRRAAMLVPTIAVLAPVMLLFIAAPLPSIVFGSR